MEVRWRGRARPGGDHSHIRAVTTVTRPSIPDTCAPSPLEDPSGTVVEFAEGQTAWPHGASLRPAPGTRYLDLITSALHAREYTTAELTLRFAEWLADNYAGRLRACRPRRSPTRPPSPTAAARRRTSRPRRVGDRPSRGLADRLAAATPNRHHYHMLGTLHIYEAELARHPDRPRLLRRSSHHRQGPRLARCAGATVKAGRGDGPGSRWAAHGPLVRAGRKRFGHFRLHGPPPAGAGPLKAVFRLDGRRCGRRSRVHDPQSDSRREVRNPGASRERGRRKPLVRFGIGRHRSSSATTAANANAAGRRIRDRHRMLP